MRYTSETSLSETCEHLANNVDIYKLSQEWCQIDKCLYLSMISVKTKFFHYYQLNENK